MRNQTVRSSAILAVFLFALLASIPSFAADTTFVGKFSDGNLTLDLSGTSDSYTGTITLGNQQFPATAKGLAQGIDGTFTSSGNALTFSATIIGDTLTLQSGGTTYTLKRLSPPANSAVNPLANAANPPPVNPLANSQSGNSPAANSAAPSASTPAAGTDAPAGYTVEVVTDSGKSLVTQKPNATSVQTALQATFPDLANYFGVRPTIGSAFQSANDSTSGGATFSATYNGQPIRGIVSVKVKPGSGATVTVIFARNDAPKADLAKLMTAPSAQSSAAPTGQAAAAAQPVPGTPVADASTPAVTLTEYDYPDGTGSIGSAPGWTVTAQTDSALDSAVITGPADQTVVMHNGMNINTPDSMAVKQRQQLEQMQAQNAANFQRMGYSMPAPKPLPPLMVAPFSDPTTALQTLAPQFSARSEFNGGPTFTLDRIISSQDLPCQLPGGKRALITYAITKTTNGQSVAYRCQVVLVTVPFQGQGAWMWFARYAVTAPDATFDHDLPLMMAMVNSEKGDQARIQQVSAARIQQSQQMGQQILAAGAAQRQASFEQFQRDQASRQEAHDQYMANTQAGYDAHNQQFAQYEQQRSINSANFDESIRGTRDIYDTVTGQWGYANLTDVNGVVDSLNQAALDPNRFVQVPLSQEMYGNPPGQ